MLFLAVYVEYVGNIHRSPINGWILPICWCCWSIRIHDTHMNDNKFSSQYISRLNKSNIWICMECQSKFIERQFMIPHTHPFRAPTHAALLASNSRNRTRYSPSILVYVIRIIPIIFYFYRDIDPISAKHSLTILPITSNKFALSLLFHFSHVYYERRLILSV